MVGTVQYIHVWFHELCVGRALIIFICGPSLPAVAGSPVGHLLAVEELVLAGHRVSADEAAEAAAAEEEEEERHQVTRGHFGSPFEATVWLVGFFFHTCPYFSPCCNCHLTCVLIKF